MSRPIDLTPGTARKPARSVLVRLRPSISGRRSVIAREAPGQGSDGLSSPFEAPKVKGGPLAAKLDWAAMFAAARAQYPGAEIRLVSLPRKPGGLILMRLRQQPEWLPNGRTLVWFRPENGALVDTRNVQAMPTGIRAYNALYPLHAGKVGGILWKLVIASTGLVLAMLGSFAVWTFWFKRPKPKPVRGARPAVAAAE